MFVSLLHCYVFFVPGLASTCGLLSLLSDDALRLVAQAVLFGVAAYLQLLLWRGRQELAQAREKANEYDYLCLEWNCEFLAQCKKHGWFRRKRA